MDSGGIVVAFGSILKSIFDTRMDFYFNNWSLINWMSLFLFCIGFRVKIEFDFLKQRLTKTEEKNLETLELMLKLQILKPF
jgi:hypothetical protein